MSASLLEGLQVVLLVSIMAIVVSPLLCWVLPDRLRPQPEKVLS